MGPLGTSSPCALFPPCKGGVRGGGGRAAGARMIQVPSSLSIRERAGVRAPSNLFTSAAACLLSFSLPTTDANSKGLTATAEAATQEDPAAWETPPEPP
jgi:hypothetical protein